MRISMPRGDIRPVRFFIKDPNGITTDIEFDEIYFTVKKVNDSTYRFQKTLSAGDVIMLEPGDYQVKIMPEDTVNMVLGNYKFYIQLNFRDEIKQTFKGDFVLME